MVFIVEQAPNAKIAQLCLEPTIKDCDSAVARWLQNLSAINTTSSGTDRSTTASLMFVNLHRARLDFANGFVTVQKARSEQHLGANQEQLRDSGISLASFWEEERVEQWKKEIFSDPQNLKEPNDGCFNMVSLDKHPHALWGAGRFALRLIEISADLKELKYGGRGLPVPTGTYKEDGEPEYRPIASGDVFSLTTDDPDKLPLPSWPLLEMQWHLQRIAGMSGAEASEDLDHNVDDDDDDDDNDAKEITTHDRDATVRSVRAISEWLRLLPEKEQSTSHPRLSIPV
ncbi:hypothetical protein RJZ57_002255 [Blastomyces gilchristii]